MTCPDQIFFASSRKWLEQRLFRNTPGHRWWNFHYLGMRFFFMFNYLNKLTAIYYDFPFYCGFNFRPNIYETKSPEIEKIYRNIPHHALIEFSWLFTNILSCLFHYRINEHVSSYIWYLILPFSLFENKVFASRKCRKRYSNTYRKVWLNCHDFEIKYFVHEDEVPAQKIHNHH